MNLEHYKLARKVAAIEPESASDVDALAKASHSLAVAMGHVPAKPQVRTGAQPDATPAGEKE